MKKKNSDVSRRAWNILRLTLLWARKGGVFRNKLAITVNLLPKYIKSLRHANERGALIYGEREFSFDDTPIIHVKMHRPSSLRFKMPHIPCINPHIDFDYDFELDDNNDDGLKYYNDAPRKSFLKGTTDSIPGYNDDDAEDYDGNCDEGIDLKAEQFIAKFYEQMKLQRQISYLEYSEMLDRGSS